MLLIGNDRCLLWDTKLISTIYVVIAILCTFPPPPAHIGLSRYFNSGPTCISRKRPTDVIPKIKVKGKDLPQQAEVAQGVPGRLRSRIFLTFGTMRVVGRQPYAPAAFTPGEIPGTHF
jgi:hypothetical protein